MGGLHWTRGLVQYLKYYWYFPHSCEYFALIMHIKYNFLHCKHKIILYFCQNSVEKYVVLNVTLRQKCHRQEVPERFLLQRHSFGKCFVICACVRKTAPYFVSSPVEVQSELSRWWRNCRQIKVCEVWGDAVRTLEASAPVTRAGIRPGVRSGGSGLFMPPSECQRWGWDFTLCLLSCSRLVVLILVSLPGSVSHVQALV